MFGLVRYSIIGNKYGFVIDQDTGIVKVNDSSFLDREVTSDFMLTIQAKDEAPPGLTKTAVVLVNIFFLLLLFYSTIFKKINILKLFNDRPKVYITLKV